MEVSGQLHAPAALTPGKEPPRSHWIGGWVGPRAGLDRVVKRKILEDKINELERNCKKSQSYIEA
jgi:hypothetical protein